MSARIFIQVVHNTVRLHGLILQQQPKNNSATVLELVGEMLVLQSQAQPSRFQSTTRNMRIAHDIGRGTAYNQPRGGLKSAERCTTLVHNSQGRPWRVRIGLVLVHPGLFISRGSWRRAEAKSAITHRAHLQARLPANNSHNHFSITLFQIRSTLEGKTPFSPTMPSFLSPPPQVADTLISFPAPHTLLVTLNRPKLLNAIHTQQHKDLASLWSWYDSEPSLRCAVIRGAGRAFCAGADLAQWNEQMKARMSPEPRRREYQMYDSAGFGGLSNRAGKKPVIAAVNGVCLGGAMEMAINCDLVVAGPRAKFGLPEAKRGVIPVAGALPRLMKTVGKQRASEMTLLGRMYGPQEMKEWGLVNFVVDVQEGGDISDEAVRLAAEIANNSPDSVIVNREGLALGWEPMGPAQSTEVVGKGLYGQMDGGENMREGLNSFLEKRDPVWKDSKL